MRTAGYMQSLQPKLGKTPEQIEAEAEARARGAGTGKFAPEKTITGETPEQRQKRQQMTRDARKVEAAIDRFQKERDRLVTHQEARAKTEEWKKRQATPHMGLFPDPLTEGIKNLETALDYLNSIRGYVSNAPLSSELNKFVTKAMGSLNSIKRGEFMPSEVKAFLKKNPGVPPEQVIALYMEWLLSQ